MTEPAYSEETIPPNPKRLKMSPSTTRKRAIRIAGCSGGFTDRSAAITRMASDPDVDVVMGTTTSPETLFFFFF